MCTRRNFLLFVCSLQLLTIIERQVFDFLGHLWLPILVNFLHMIFIIFGFFGAYQFRTKYLISYSIWNVLWIGWNTFIICFYLSVGILDRDSDILNFGTGTVSWFESNGLGCKPIYPTNATLEDPFRLIRPERVDGCFLDYPIVEVIHSGVQSFLAFFGLIGAICICCSIWNDDDSFEFMGSDVKSPQHTCLHPMYVACSYTSLKVLPANGSGSSMQLNSKKDPNQFGVVLTSINNSNTNSLSSTYLKIHNCSPSNISSPSKTHHHSIQMQSPTNYKPIDHRQLSSSSNLSQYNSRNDLINKSASTQQIIKRNPSFTSANRSDIRYTEIIAATDDILNDDRDVDTNSVRSYGRPSSQASTAAASPIISSKLMATNLQQQQLISKSFGIRNNPLNNLMHNDDNNERIRVNSKQSMDYEFSNHGQQKNQQKLYSANSSSTPPPVPRVDYNVNVNKYLPNQTNSIAKSYQIPPTDDKPPFQKHPYIAISPNLNHMPRKRQSPHHQNPALHQLETSHSNGKLSTPVGNYDQIRDRPLRYNLNQFIPEYHCPNPLPAIPPHMLQHPMYRVRSQDRISHRLKRQSGAHPYEASPHENQRPRSFCNNMINYQDYKDIQ